MLKIFGIRYVFIFLIILIFFKFNRIFFFLNWSVILVSIGVMFFFLFDLIRR